MINYKKYIGSIFLALCTYSSANDIPVAKVVTTFDERPGNLTISKDGRMFVSIHPLINPETKVVEVSVNGKKNVYPNAQYSSGANSIINATIAVKTDAKSNLWVLDLGGKKIVVWDTKKNRLKKIINVPSEVMTKTSFLQDFVLDEKRNRVIIADMTQGDLKSPPTPAFIVINTINEDAKRIAQGHKSMMPDFEGGFALNPIAIDPEFKWVYYGSIHGKKVYRVPAESFDSEENVVKNIEEYGIKSYSDGIAVDAKQNVYITDIEKQAIGVTTKDSYKIIATLPEGQTWPDGLAVSDNGYLYATVNQLNKSAALNNGVEEGTSPYLIVKTKLEK